MQHKLLLGSTALVSAGLFMSGSAVAQETVGGIEVVLGGYTEWGVKAANKDTLTDAGDSQNYLFFMDNEVFVNANGATEGGILYGSELELEVGSGDGNASDATVDEITFYFSGNFGRVELGREDGAEDVMAVNGNDAQSGTGGLDGDTTNLLPFVAEVPDTGDDNKATYFTPRVAGFQLGASFVPNTGDIPAFEEQPGEFKNVVGLGGNWVGALGPADLTVAGTGIIGDGQTGDTDDLRSWEAGALLGFGGFTLGGGYGQNTDAFEAQFATVGLEYGFGAANVSVGWGLYDPDDGDTANLFAVSGDIGLLPGVTLKGDATYNTDDTGADADEPDNPDDTVRGSSRSSWTTEVARDALSRWCVGCRAAGDPAALFRLSAPNAQDDTRGRSFPIGCA
jgi:outer membrane protein OmpU